MQREQRVTVWPAGPRSSAEPAGMLQSPRWEGRSRSQGLGGPPSPRLWAHTASLAGGPGRGRAGGAGRRAPGPRGLAQVLLVTLDGLLDAQQHGGEPLVQPGDGVVLLHLRAGRRAGGERPP